MTRITVAIPTMVTSELSIELTIERRIPQSTRIAFVQATVAATSTIESTTQRRLRNKAKITSPNSSNDA